MNINSFITNKRGLIIIISVVLIAILLGINTLATGNILSSDESSGDLPPVSTINPRHNEIMQNGSGALSESTVSLTENTVSSSTPDKQAASTTPASTAPATTAAATTVPQTTSPYATAIKPDTPADYSEQWNLGYLIAIDNPDRTYACANVELSDEDRDLLERLCMGEFGSGGFIGASLIAQAVKDAMCFDGYGSVAEVIRECRYTGSINMGASDECRQAVRYIFDENHDAVQHRIMYMYNPSMVESTFHESQNFILSYGGVRFFDRWAY